MIRGKAVELSPEMDDTLRAESLTFSPHCALLCSSARPSGPARRLAKGGPLCRAGRNLDGWFGACSSMASNVRNNPDKGRFELDLGGQVVFARYARHGSGLVIPHVEAPPSLRGTGAAGQLMAGGVGGFP